jgi:hypothetical protein
MMPLSFRLIAEVLTCVGESLVDDPNHASKVVEVGGWLPPIHTTEFFLSFSHATTQVPLHFLNHLLFAERATKQNWQGGRKTKSKHKKDSNTLARGSGSSQRKPADPPPTHKTACEAPEALRSQEKGHWENSGIVWDSSIPTILPFMTFI